MIMNFIYYVMMHLADWLDSFSIAGKAIKLKCWMVMNPDTVHMVDWASLIIIVAMFLVIMFSSKDKN